VCLQDYGSALGPDQTGSLPLTSHRIGTMRVLVHPRRQHTSPRSFLARRSALRFSSPPGSPTQIPSRMCRSTASFGSRLDVVGTTWLHSGHWGAMRSIIEGGSGEVQECCEGRKWGWQKVSLHAGH
jgi:hypothetical protein